MINAGIAIIDDDPAITRALSLVLPYHGFPVCVEINDSREAIERINEFRPWLVICDLGMPNLSGEEVLQQLNELHPELPVIIITAVNEVETAVRCMKKGAIDYLVKPVKEGGLIPAVRRVMQVKELQNENRLLRSKLSNHTIAKPEVFAPLITNSPKMHSIFEYMEVVAVASQPVLIAGETGTGKELIARALHELKGHGEFVAINTAGLDENAFSDTLFGHVKGAFTGAEGPRSGLVEKANGGTLFLDEIGDLSIGAQVKLLRLLQEAEYMPLGSDETRHTTARIVLATLHDLEELVEKGTFRRDLYYRLAQYSIKLPPLRERKEDIYILADHFLELAAMDLRMQKPELSPKSLEYLEGYSFPGNIRELQGIINEALSLSKGGKLSPQFFAERLKTQAISSPLTNPAKFLEALPTLPPLKDVRTLIVEEALRRSNNNQAVAARMLGVSRQSISKHAQSIKEKEGRVGVED